MNLLDLLIVLLLLSAGFGGYRLGFVARATSWVGMGIGLFVAARLLPALLRSLEGGSRGSVFLAATALLIGGAFVGQALGLLAGSRISIGIPPGAAQLADKVAGALIAVVGVTTAVWLLLPAIAAVPEWPAEQARNSVIARAIDGTLPEPPDALQALRRVVGADGFPQVFATLRPAPDVGPPPAVSGLDPGIVDLVRPSIVRVEGLACNRLQEGSGFVSDPGLVVTNAHVVAGQEATRVFDAAGERLSATVVGFDADRDLALLSVPGLERPALLTAQAPIGTEGAAFGHPGGGLLSPSPFRISDQVKATGLDLYDNHETVREVLFLSAALEPGDSGAPLIDPLGHVVGVAFAVAPDDPEVAYALTIAEFDAFLAETNADSPVDSSRCL